MTEIDQAPSEPASPPVGALTRGRNAVVDALRFFTRLGAPAGWGTAAPGVAMMSGVAAAAPLAGAVVGGVAGFALVAALAIGLPPTPSAAFAVAAATIASGALHLDGLADCADGFGGGRDRARKLEIMRDSRLGVYGGAALALALIARVTLVAALVDRSGAVEAALALIAAAAIARPLAFLPLLALAPARTDGLAANAAPSRLAAGVGAALAALVALAASGPAAALASIAFALVAALAIVSIARRQIGGCTGDVCGAAAETAEIAALAGLLAAASPA